MAKEQKYFYGVWQAVTWNEHTPYDLSWEERSHLGTQREGNPEVAEGRHVWLPTCLALRLTKYKDAAKKKEDLCEFMFFAHGI